MKKADAHTVFKSCVQFNLIDFIEGFSASIGFHQRSAVFLIWPANYWLMPIWNWKRRFSFHQVIWTFQIGLVYNGVFQSSCIWKAGNLCFTGHCSYYCDTTHAVCGKPIDRLEASLQLVLPRKPYIDWSTMYNPYRRSYNKRKKTEWEMDDNYCENKVFQDVYFQSKSLLDLIDVTIFDFLTGKLGTLCQSINFCSYRLAEN